MPGERLGRRETEPQAEGLQVQDHSGQVSKTQPLKGNDRGAGGAENVAQWQSACLACSRP